MKLRQLIFLWVMSGIGGVVNAQQVLETKIQLERSDGSRLQFLKEIESQAGVIFSYNPETVDVDSSVEVKIRRGTLKVILEQIFSDQPVSFMTHGTRVLIIRGKRSKTGKRTINGYVRDMDTGEVLIGATISARPVDASGQGFGVAANIYGFYSLSLPEGAYRLVITYVGYEAVERELHIDENQRLDFDLKESFTELKEVVVESTAYEEEEDSNYASNDMGKNTLGIKTIREMPALFGEVDVVKALQLLPGVQVQGEGSTNFFVRGGNSDQNLVLLDEATVYNASHLMGFFSIFNPDALNYMKFYRGHIPAAHGGRLSSLLDIRMKEGNNKKMQVSGGVGVTSARFTVEGPIAREKSSFMLSGRRTYLDQFLRFSGDDLTKQTRIYFYDLNAKLNYRIDDRNKIFLSGYFGRDLNKILVLQYVIDWGNTTGTLRWNHIFNDRLFSNTTLVYSKYDYLIDLSDENTPFNWRSEVEDITFKQDFDFFLHPDYLLSFGLQSTFHRFIPGESKEDPNSGVPRKRALESAAYFSADHEITERLSLNYGLRYSLYQLFGETTLFEYDDAYNITSERQTQGDDIYQTYGGFEPRISARHLLGGNNSIKMSYNRNRQYMQLLSNLSLGFNVFDIWYPSSNRIRPQIADHFSMGYFQNLKNNKYELSAELYYKKLHNQVDYADHSVLIMNRELEAQLRTGDGEAYGMELMFRKNGRLNGWLSYTYSRALRQIEGINDSREYPALYDQPHAFSVVGNYRLTPRWTLSVNWNYASGRPVSLPDESYRFEQYIVPVYGSKNNERMPGYHRLDVSFTLFPKEKPGRKNESSWNFGVYNLYARRNAASVFVSAELEDIDLVKDPDRPAFHRLSLFGIIPSIAYNFKF